LCPMEKPLDQMRCSAQPYLLGGEVDAHDAENCMGKRSTESQKSTWCSVYVPVNWGQNPLPHIWTRTFFGSNPSEPATVQALIQCSFNSVLIVRKSFSIDI